MKRIASTAVLTSLFLAGAAYANVELNTVGFLTPGGQGFRFDDDGASHSLGHGSRHELVARVLGTSSHVRFRAVGVSR